MIFSGAEWVEIWTGKIGLYIIAFQGNSSATGMGEVLEKVPILRFLEEYPSR